MTFLEKVNPFSLGGSVGDDRQADDVHIVTAPNVASGWTVFKISVVVFCAAFWGAVIYYFFF